MPNQVILIVEDNETEQYVLSMLVKKFDYDVQVAPSGEAAITAIGVTNYAAILMDINLPGISGIECTQRIRRIELESGRRTPIIGLSARTESEDEKMCADAGMDDYVRKPFEPEQLRKMLLRYVYDPTQPNLKTLSPLPQEELDIKIPIIEE